jgi:hypothetical protein
MEDSSTNSSLVYNYLLSPAPVMDMAFLFLDWAPVKFEIRRSSYDGSYIKHEPDVRLLPKYEITHMFVPVNFKNRTNEIQHLIYTYLVTSSYGIAENYKEILEDTTYRCISFPPVEYVRGALSVESSKWFTIYFYGPHNKTESQEQNLLNLERYMEGFRAEGQLYTFRLVYNESIIDFQLYFTKKSEIDATYQINNVSIPADFLSEIEFLLGLIQQAMTFFAKSVDNIDNARIDTTKINFKTGLPKVTSLIEPDFYPLNY